FLFPPASPRPRGTLPFPPPPSDSDGSIAGLDWDLDNDGFFDDGTGTSVSRSFSTPGTKTVRLRAPADDGLTDIAARTVTVGNRAPTASFDFSPTTPITDDTVTFTSASSD